LQFVPVSERTPELCEAAASSPEGTLMFVPMALRTEALYAKAVENAACHMFTKRTYDVIGGCGSDPDDPDEVPMAFRTRLVCDVAMRKYPLDAISNVPDALITQEYHDVVAEKIRDIRVRSGLDPRNF
jgi:hypothetical protein